MKKIRIICKLIFMCLVFCILNGFTSYAAGGTNLAKDKDIQASGYSSFYKPKYANDGLEALQFPSPIYNRWYVYSAGEKWLRVDLGDVYLIDQWVVKGMGSMNNLWSKRNLYSYRLQKSMDGTNWTDVDVVINNTSNVTERQIVPFSTRYVRLYIDQGNQYNNLWVAVSEFEVYGVAEIDIIGNGTSIENGDSTPSLTDDTDFGSVDINGGTVTKIYMVTNTGNGILHLNGSTKVNIGGENASSFTVAQTPSSSIGKGMGAPFGITFDPSEGGIKRAIITIENDDPDENPYTFTIQGLGVGVGMNVKGNGVLINNGDTTPIQGDDTDFGEVRRNQGSVIKTYTIESVGTEQLRLTGTTISGASDFTVVKPPVTILNSGENTTFEVCFEPSNLGPRTATINIENNSNNTPYSFKVQGTGTAPEIGIEGNGQSIIDGDATPSVSDATDFEGVNINGQTTKKIYTIKNSGMAQLNLTGNPIVSISGVNADEFSVTKQPEITIGSGEDTTFELTFNPKDIGIRLAMITIENDDDESSYTFKVQGTGIASEIEILGNGQSIIDKDATPSVLDATDFEDVNVNGQTMTKTYTIQNSGTAQLILSGNSIVSISGANPDEFTVTAQPATTINSGGNTTFNITFNPSDAGLRTAVISIDNDDLDESPYTFAVQGTGIGPKMQVTRNSQIISNGDMGPSDSEHTEFGEIGTIGGQITKTYTIENVGNDQLQLVGLTISGTNSGEFILGVPSASTIDAGENITFDVTFVPDPIGISGVRNAIISIGNNDEDENPYEFAIQGTNLICPNQVPVNTVPGAQICDEDMALTFSVANGNSISVSDVDSGTSPMDITLTTDNGTLTLGATTGLIFVQGDGTNDKVLQFLCSLDDINATFEGMIFMPDENYSGPANITIVSNDQGNAGLGGVLLDTDIIDITIKAVNDSPVTTIPVSQSAYSNYDITFSIMNGNAIQILDVDATMVEVTLTATKGILTLGHVNGLTFTTGDGTEDLDMCFTGTIDNINGALENLIFTPQSNYVGLGSLTIRVDDLGSTGLGGSLSSIETIDIILDPIPTYTVIFKDWDGMILKAETVEYGNDTTAPLNPRRNGYRFTGWNAGYTNVQKDLTIIALYTWISRTKSKPKPKSEKIEDGSVTLIVPDINEDRGEAKVRVSYIDLDEAFSQADENENGKKKVELKIPDNKGMKRFEIELPKSSLVADKKKEIEIKTNIGIITLPGNMLDNEESWDSSNISLNFKKVEKEELKTFDKINDETKQEIGDKPIIEISRMEDGQIKPWENNNAPVKISIPYTPTPEERKNKENIVVWYIDGEGNAIKVTSGRYNPDTGMVEFDVTHFSTYAIAYTVKTFDDLDAYLWAKHQIEVLAVKGITNGTGNNNYSPGAKITRADFLTLLIRTLQLSGDFENNFDDVKESDYYYEVVGIAKELGITAGDGNNRFNPKAYITREDMMVLTDRALRMKGLIHGISDNSILDGYTDKSQIATYAIDSVSSLVNNEIIQGSNHMINPKGNTTRAEAAVVLYKIYNMK